jgi:hypothetical protein
MAKNFSDIYSGNNDSSGLEQKLFFKEELSTARGVPIPPVNADFIFQLAGGAATFSRPFEASPIRSGRHNVTGIEKKDVTEWSYPFYMMIDTALGGVSDAEIDPSARLLYKSAFGKELSIGAGDANLEYNTSSAPSVTMTIFENGDSWAKQVHGAFVDSLTLNLPGDGEATYETAGQAKTLVWAGIGQSNALNDANIVTLETGDGGKFEVGAFVMIIETDGTTRSSDTPDGSPRQITGITGDVVTIDGAILADADGSSTPVYLTYYEPAAPVAINDPQTGLVGKIAIGGIADQCVRTATVALENNHEVINYCFGERGLAGPLFAPTSRASVTVTIDMNFNAELLGMMVLAKDFDGFDVDIDLGDTTSRHMHLDIPKWIPSIPSVPVPEEGTIPVTWEGMAYATSETAADEITVQFL